MNSYSVVEIAIGSSKKYPRETWNESLKRLKKCKIKTWGDILNESNEKQRKIT